MAAYRFPRLRRADPHPFGLAHRPLDPAMLGGESWSRRGLIDITLVYGDPLDLTGPLAEITTSLPDATLAYRPSAGFLPPFPGSRVRNERRSPHTSPHRIPVNAATRTSSDASGGKRSRIACTVARPTANPRRRSVWRAPSPTPSVEGGRRGDQLLHRRMAVRVAAGLPHRPAAGVTGGMTAASDNTISGALPRRAAQARLAPQSADEQQTPPAPGKTPRSHL
jgi:hypothetical protein